MFAVRMLLILALAMGACNRKPAASPADARAAQLEKENQELRAALEQKTRELAELRVEPAPRTEAPAAVRKKEPAARVDDSATIQQLRDALLEANRQNSELQVRVEKLEAAVAAARAESVPLNAALADLREKLTASASTAEAASRELKEKTERLSQTEAANRRLRDEATAQAQRNSGLARAVAELEDLDRRRENVLTSVLRRYREVSEQYRALAGTPDARRPIDASAARVADFSRINESLNMAEEDLRQLHALNAQAQSAHRKLR
jgi:chromosome segregation ATPase